MDLLFDGEEEPGPLVVLAHGAGAPMDSPFMNEIATRLAGGGVAVARFEFPYMAARRKGVRRPVDRTAVLLGRWREAVEAVRERAPLFIGGKSLGGRMATMVADELGVAGVICLGYPFHPPGKPSSLRVEHLRTLRTPALILQGERDPFGTREEVAGYPLSESIELVWIDDGDHSLQPRKRSGRSAEQNLDDAVEAILRFIDEVAGARA